MSRDAIGQHYGAGDLADRVLQALKSAQGDSQTLNWTEFAPIDQFHVRGLAATKEMAEALRLRAGAAVLDIGCGLGGSARFLAANYKCHVTGIDVNEPFIALARLLTQKAALNVTYEVMNALNLIFEDNSFDFAWTQHVAMNIRERAVLYANMHRVLKPGGRIAIYDVTNGDKGPLLFPVPWARTQEISFLLTEQEMGAALRAAGFVVISSKNQTALGVEWFREQQARSAGKPQSVLGLELVMGPEFSPMAANLARNLQEGRAGLVQVIADKPRH